MIKNLTFIFLAAIIIVGGLYFINMQSTPNNNQPQTLPADQNLPTMTDNDTDVSSESTGTYGMIVASELADCTGVTPRKCFLVKEAGASTWSLFYDEIEGFSYEPGYEYHLIVTRTPLANSAPADAGSYRYTLEEVREKNKTQSDTRPESDKPMFESKWQLQTLNGRDVSSYHGYIHFQTDKAALYVGCNQMGADFTADDGNTIAFTPGMSTMMYCPDSIETEFKQTLTEATIYTVADNVLTLKNTQGKTLMTLTR